MVVIVDIPTFQRNVLPSSSKLSMCDGFLSCCAVYYFVCTLTFRRNCFHLQTTQHSNPINHLYSHRLENMKSYTTSRVRYGLKYELCCWQNMFVPSSPHIVLLYSYVERKCPCAVLGDSCVHVCTTCFKICSAVSETRYVGTT